MCTFPVWYKLIQNVILNIAVYLKILSNFILFSHVYVSEECDFQNIVIVDYLELFINMLLFKEKYE